MALMELATTDTGARLVESKIRRMAYVYFDGPVALASCGGEVASRGHRNCDNGGRTLFFGHAGSRVFAGQNFKDLPSTRQNAESMGCVYLRIELYWLSTASCT